MAELRELAPSMFEEEGEDIVLKHLYIERRMVPLNLYLDNAADEAKIDHGGANTAARSANWRWPTSSRRHAVEELRRHPLQPRGVLRLRRDREYMTDMNFREIPEAPDYETEMSGEVWYSVARNDVFPEEFGTFLLGSPKVRQAFMKHHRDLLTAKFWQDEGADPGRQGAGFLSRKRCASATPLLTG